MLSIEIQADRYLAVLLLQVVFMVYMVAYFIIALRVTYREGWWKSTLKFLVLLLVFLPVLGLAIDIASH